MHAGLEFHFKHSDWQRHIRRHDLNPGYHRHDSEIRVRVLYSTHTTGLHYFSSLLKPLISMLTLSGLCKVRKLAF